MTVNSKLHPYPLHRRPQQSDLLFHKAVEARHIGRRSADAQLVELGFELRMASTSLHTVLSRATLSAGTLAGPDRPKKFSSTSLGCFSSTTVGASGISGDRTLDVTASGSSWPLLENSTYDVITSMPTGITPANRTVVMGAPPR